MRLRKSAIPRLVLFSAFVVIINLGVAETPSPILLVLLRGQSTLAFVDPVAGKIVGRVSTGDSPHEVVASSDGKLAFASSPNDSTITVIDVPGQKELRRITIGPRSRLHDLLFAGGKLYFTAEGYKAIGRYNPASDRVDWLFGTGQDRTHMLAISRDMNKIFASNVGSNSVTAIEGVALGPPDWNSTVIPVGKSPEGIDMSPDNREVWTATWGDGGISIIDVATRKVSQTLSLGTKHVNRIRFTPDGRQVLLTDAGGGDLLVYDALSRREIKRMKVGQKPPSALLVLPDSSRAYVAVDDDSVAIIDLKTLQVIGRIPTGPGSEPGCMAWVEPR